MAVARSTGESNRFHLASNRAHVLLQGIAFLRPGVTYLAGLKPVGRGDVLAPSKPFVLPRTMTALPADSDAHLHSRWTNRAPQVRWPGRPEVGTEKKSRDHPARVPSRSELRDELSLSALITAEVPKRRFVGAVLDSRQSNPATRTIRALDLGWVDLVHLEGDRWIDLRPRPATSPPGLLPIVCGPRPLEPSGAEWAEAFNPDLGLTQVDVLDVRDEAEILADMAPLAAALSAIPSVDPDVLASAVQTLETSCRQVDPFVVARLRAAARVTHDRGLSGRLLDITLDRAGWHEVQVREVARRVEAHLAKAEAEAAALVSAAEEHIEEKRRDMERQLEEVVSRVTEADETIRRLDERRSVLSQAIVAAELEGQRTVSRLIGEALDDDGPFSRALVARIVDRLRTEIAPSDKAPEPNCSCEALLEQQPAVCDPDLGDAVGAAADFYGVSATATRQAAAACLAGILPVVVGTAAGDLPQAIAHALAGGSLYRIDCDPSLLHVDDLKRRSDLVACRDRALATPHLLHVLHLAAVDLAPTTYWIDRLTAGRDASVVPPNVLILTTASGGDDRNALREDQLLGTLLVVAEAQDAMRSLWKDRPRVIAAAPIMEELKDLRDDLLELSEWTERIPSSRRWWEALARLRRVGRVLLGLSNKEVDAMIEATLSWWSGVGGSDAQKEWRKSFLTTGRR